MPVLLVRAELVLHFTVFNSNEELIEMTKISVTHVGSLPRSQDVVDFIFARENNEPYDQESFDRCMSSAVSDTVAKQVAAGVDRDGRLGRGLSHTTEPGFWMK